MYTRLKEEMKRQHKTAFALSKVMGISSSDLYASIKGTRPLYPKYKRLLSEALNVPQDVLFPEEEGVKDHE